MSELKAKSENDKVGLWQGVAVLFGAALTGALSLFAFAGWFESKVHFAALAVVAITGMMAVFSKSAGKAWRKVFFICAALSFVFPLAMVTGVGSDVLSDVGTKQGAEVAGGLIATGLVGALSGFIGFFLGVVFLVLALLTGREPKIVYIQQAVPPTE